MSPGSRSPPPACSSARRSTPRPNSLSGGHVDARSDLFSAAVVAFEMLAGRPPFAGATLAGAGPRRAARSAAGAHRVAGRRRCRPRAAPGAGQVAGRALSHGGGIRRRSARRRWRWSTAARSWRLGRSCGSPCCRSGSSSPTPTPTISVRASPTRWPARWPASSRWSCARPSRRPATPSRRSISDRIAADLAVDVVLSGTLLPTRGRMRVSAELVAVPAGDVWWTHVDRGGARCGARAARRAGPAGAGGAAVEPARRADAAGPRGQREGVRVLPARHAAARRSRRAASGARVLRAEPRADPAFAAAWAERGRLERVLGKFEDPSLLAQAEASLRRALALDPDNGAAQYYLAQLEIDLGRVGDSLARLLERAWQRRAEPHVFAALVHACRYGGLLDASVAAHRAAVRLDPAVPTSVLHTYYHQARLRARARRAAPQQRSDSRAGSSARWAGTTRPSSRARREETRYARDSAAAGVLHRHARRPCRATRGEALAAMRPFEQRAHSDGEMLFYVAEIYALVGDYDRAFARSGRGRGRRLPVCRRPSSATPTWRRCGPRPAWSPLIARADRRAGRLSARCSTSIAARRCSASEPAHAPGAASGASSRSSHALANFQSRITVSGDTASTSAVSSTVRPPK